MKDATDQMKDYIDNLGEKVDKRADEISKHNANATWLLKEYKAGRISKQKVRKFLNLAKREMKQLAKDKKLVDQQLNGAQKRIEEIEFLGVDQFNNIFKGIAVEDFKEQFNGIYIVAKKEQDNKTELVKLYDLVKNERKPMKIQINNLPTGIKGDDGQPVDTTLGALLLVTKVSDKSAPSGVGFHFCNVGPSEPESQIQYEYALWKLGLGIQPKGAVNMEVIDGQFRVLLSKRALDERQAS